MQSYDTDFNISNLWTNVKDSFYGIIFLTRLPYRVSTMITITNFHTKNLIIIVDYLEMENSI